MNFRKNMKRNNGERDRNIPNGERGFSSPSEKSSKSKKPNKLMKMGGLKPIKIQDDIPKKSSPVTSVPKKKDTQSKVDRPLLKLQELDDSWEGIGKIKSLNFDRSSEDGEKGDYIGKDGISRRRAESLKSEESGTFNANL